MFGNAVEFECLDMREWLRFSETRNCFQGGSRTGTYDHVGAAQQTLGPIGRVTSTVLGAMNRPVPPKINTRLPCFCSFQDTCR